MKLFIMSIAVLYALALSNDIAESKAAEYCFKKEEWSFLRLRSVKQESRFKENVIYLPEEYKYCKLDSKETHAKVSFDENLVLETPYSSFTPHNYEKKYDSIFVSEIYGFHCSLSGWSHFGGRDNFGNISYIKECILKPEKECTEENEEHNNEENKEYNNIILPILKKSIGKTFTVEIVVEAKCPSNANDTNYSEKKNIKINRPIVIIGECTK